MGTSDVSYFVKLSDKIDSVKSKIAERRGERKQLVGRLKDIGLNSVSEAKREIAAIEEELPELEKQIRKDVNSLKGLLED